MYPEDTNDYAAQFKVSIDYTRPTYQIGEFGSLWIHVRSGGIYTTVQECQIEYNDTLGILYKSLEGGKLWCRPMEEFLDGRFKPINILDYTHQT